MQGYKFNTEEEAVAARKAAADYKGLPVNPVSTTIYWVDYNYSDLDGYYYIRYIDGLEAVFGDPTDVTITPHEEI